MPGLLNDMRASGHMTHYGDRLVYYIGLQVSITSAGHVAKELAKAAAATDQAPNKSSAKGKKGGGDKGKGGKEGEPMKEKPKRKGPIDAVPTTPEDWAGYDVPDEVSLLIGP